MTPDKDAEGANTPSFLHNQKDKNMKTGKNINTVNAAALNAVLDLPEDTLAQFISDIGQAELDPRFWNTFEKAKLEEKKWAKQSKKSSQ